MHDDAALARIGTTCRSVADPIDEDHGISRLQMNLNGALDAFDGGPLRFHSVFGGVRMGKVRLVTSGNHHRGAVAIADVVAVAAAGAASLAAALVDATAAAATVVGGSNISTSSSRDGGSGDSSKGDSGGSSR